MLMVDLDFGGGLYHFTSRKGIPYIFVGPIPKVIDSKRRFVKKIYLWVEPSLNYDGTLRVYTAFSLSLIE